MSSRNVITNRFLRAQGNFYPSFCTIQRSTESQMVDGSIVDEWVDVETLKAIPAAVAPPSTSYATQERRGEDYDSTDQDWRVSLQGHFAFNIRVFDRAIVHKNKDDYSEKIGELNILTVENDSHSAMTRLRCELLKV